MQPVDAAFSWFNTAEDVDTAVSAMQELAP